MNSNELKHYGVLGMKWGVRRARGTASKSSRRNKPMSDDAREVATIKKKKVREMSNAELKRANERIRLEQEYSRLNPTAINKGWKYVAGTVGVMGTMLALKNNSSQLIDIGKNVVNGVKQTKQLLG